MNRFAALDNSDNEEETPKVSTQKKTKEQSATKVAKKEPVKTEKAKENAPVNKESNKATEKPKAAAAVESEGVKEDSRGGRPRGKDGRHGERTQKKDEAQEGEDKPRRPKREFERRSGTGRGKEVSRGGRGPYGAGNVDQEAQDAEKNPKAVEGEEQQVADQVKVDGEEVAPVDNVPETEPEPTTFTLDEYLEKRNSARASSTLLGEVKPARVVDLASQFAGLTTKQESEEVYLASKVVKAAAVKKEQRSSNKSLLDVAVSYEAREAPRKREYDNNRSTRPAGKFVKGGNNTKKNIPAKAFDQGEFPSL